MGRSDYSLNHNQGITPALTVNIGPYTYDEYLDQVRVFHGHIAPGMVIGGFMVDLALKNLPEGEFFNALCETPKCLPDAVQLLTPCTIGNGWLKVINMGRYAVTLYEKYGGKGVRVYIDAPKTNAWPELKGWYFKLKPKKEQDFERLMAEIKHAGSGVCTTKSVQLDPDFIKLRRRRAFKICVMCGESYPSADGAICRGCQGEAPYVYTEVIFARNDAVPTDFNDIAAGDGAGTRTSNDIIRIVPGREKKSGFRRR